jgi:hypothetical protein
MADQQLTRKQPTEVVLQQGASGAVAQHTQSQLQEIRTVTRIGLAEYDLTYHQLQAYLALDGRDAHHQQWLQDKAAHLMYGYERAHDGVVQTAWQDIIKNRPEAIVRTVYVEQPPKSLLRRLSGK